MYKIIPIQDINDIVINTLITLSINSDVYQQE